MTPERLLLKTGVWLALSHSLAESSLEGSFLLLPQARSPPGAIAWFRSTPSLRMDRAPKPETSVSFPELPSLAVFQSQSWGFFLGRALLLDPRV